MKYKSLEKWKQEPLRWGFWYKVPRSLELGEWGNWRVYMLKHHTLQYVWREAVSDAWYWFCRTFKDWKYSIKVIFKPYHADIRKAIPREWRDISSLIVDVNFAMIESFFQEDQKRNESGWAIDWNSDEGHIEFRTWLDNAHNWITQGRPNYLKMKDAAYPKDVSFRDPSRTYEEMYGEVDRIEKLIDETDTKIIQEAVKYRDYMWT